MNDDCYETKPWLSCYGAEIPAAIDPEFPSLLAAFFSAVNAAPDQPALHYFDSTLTFRQLDEASSRLAAELSAGGFIRGDRLGLYLQNNPAFVIGQLACWKLGGIAVAINPMNKAGELAYILRDSGARALLCLDTLYRDVVEDVGREEPDLVPFVVTCSNLDGQTLNDHRVLDRPCGQFSTSGVLSLREIVDRGRLLASCCLSHLVSDDVAMLTYTSGTTGKPKGVMNTHGNLVFTAQTYRDWIGLNATDKILGIAPLFHVTGAVAHVALSFLARCPLILAHRFHPDVILDTLRQHRPSFTIGAITAFMSLMKAPGAKRDDFSSFKAIYTGGAPMSPATAKAFEAFSGVYPHNAFGMTETCSPTHLVPFGHRAPVDPQSGAISIGVPVFNTSVRVVDDEGQVVPVGASGEILDRGPQVMKGYWQQPQATLAVMADGWLKTGDVGFMDEKGWFYLIDRKKDMINVSGYKVWPREVEDVLYRHPAVFEALVVGVPDDYRGESVKAVVSLNAGCQISAAELIEHCKMHLAAYKYPRSVEIMAELPKSATGKLMRRSVR
ncbi:class I adenylate-forming enzyme family protein [Pseudomonas putida]|uniref:class I adenylate-forming enzyme family protein n=1 Tax=Pseudomonas putida TaxID=303 RepID=UPI003839FD12